MTKSDKSLNFIERDSRDFLEIFENSIIKEHPWTQQKFACLKLTVGTLEKGGEIGPVRHPFVLPSRRCGILSLAFSNFGLVLEIHMNLCVTELDSPENVFSLQNWEIDQKWAKNMFFFSIYWKFWFLNFYWICSIMKV